MSECSLEKRVIPHIENCDPRLTDINSDQFCKRGDWVDPAIADCERTRTYTTTTCTPQFYRQGYWIVEPALAAAMNNDVECQAVSETKAIQCGERNTRCVCSSNPSDFVNHCKCQYWDERTGAGPGFCTGYQDQNLHWACCTDYTNEDMECNTRTWSWPSGSLNKCSVPEGSRPAPVIKYNFNCGDCDCQKACHSSCNTKIGMLLAGKSSDSCGEWLDCFRGCCLEADKQNRERNPSRKRQDTAPNLDVFCGDNVCNSTESSTSCPEDCCQNVNSQVCTPKANVCLLECCSESNCCIMQSNSDSVVQRGISLWNVLLVWQLSYFMLPILY